MKILFITPSPLGDTVLSTGLLKHLIDTYPDADITIATGPLGMDLLSATPGLEKLISLKKQKRHGHWVSLWKEAVGQKWDIVTDLRNSAVSRLIVGNKKYIKSAGKFDPTAHVVVQNAQIMGLGDNPPSPEIYVPDIYRNKATKMISDDDQPVLGVGPTANFVGKMWPPEYFVELLRRLTSKGANFESYKIAIFGAPGEEDQIRLFLNNIDSEKVINLVGKTKTGEGAACLRRCQFFIGNDSGLMHCSAAVGVRTLGLFGPSRHANYHPWGQHCDYIRTLESRDELIGYEGFDPSQIKDSMMYSLTVDMVESKINEMLV